MTMNGQLNWPVKLNDDVSENVDDWKGHQVHRDDCDVYVIRDDQLQQCVKDQYDAIEVESCCDCSIRDQR